MKFRTIIVGKEEQKMNKREKRWRPEYSPDIPRFITLIIILPFFAEHYYTEDYLGKNELLDTRTDQ